jgi:Holliday junction resolvase RusA-like endonuclease
VRLIIRVKGRPAPQGSKDLGSAGQLLEQSPYLPAWRQAVKVGAYRAYQSANIRHEQLPLFPRGEPVELERCVFIMQPDQCRAAGTDEPTGEPDVDKLLRATLDALGGAKKGSARLFADDSQVVVIDGLRKVRPLPGVDGYDRPGALIIVRSRES